MTIFSRRVQKEIEHFYQLSHKARLLLLSYYFHSASSPIIGTFTNAYIWREQQSLVDLGIYNLGNFLALPFIFMLNGLLLNKIRLNNLYFAGAISSGLSSLLIVFLPNTSLLSYLFFGALYGVGNGIYWANRNYLTQTETISHKRNYFVGVNYTLDLANSILIPFITGWFIYTTGLIELLTRNIAYQVSMIFAFILLIMSGYIIRNIDFTTPRKITLNLPRPSKRWIAARLISASLGISEGILFFFPTMLVLARLGHEGTLGTIDSLIALTSALLTYIYGRKAGLHHQRPVFLASLTLGLLGAAFLLFTAKAFTLLYLAFSTVSIYFLWLSAEPLFMDIVDQEVTDHRLNRYWLIVDRELYLNLGRTVSVLILFLLWFWNQTLTLRITPIITMVLAAVLISFAWKNFRADLS